MPVWINEFHYDNVGTDTGEFVELAGTAGTNLAGWQIVRYNGTNPAAATVYTSPGSITVGGVIPDQQNGFGTVSFALPTDGLQNGGNDGFALVDAGNTVVQVLSYEGAFTASGGPAAGRTSESIPVAEGSNTPSGASLHLTGTGDEYADFAWSATNDDSPGAVNAGQSFGGVTGETVSIDDAAVAEGDAGAAVLTFTVSRTGNTGAFTLGYATADGTATVAGNDYAATSGTLSFAAGGALVQAVSVTVNGDTTTEPAETLRVLLSGLVDTAGTTTIADATGTGTIQNDDVALVEIPAIQGVGHKSGFVGGAVGEGGNSGTVRVTTEGVVAAIAGNGFYLQDATGDGDDATSDGIFVFTGAAPAASITVGETVRILDARVDEFRAGSNNLTVTQLNLGPSIAGASIRELGGDTVLDPVVLGVERSVPTGSISDPGFATYDPATDAADFWETLEGMLVEVPHPVAISPTNEFRTRDPADSANAEGPPNQEIWVTTGDAYDASSQTPRGGLIISASDYNPERIQLDDITPALDLPQVDVGARLSTARGVVNYDFGNYEVLVSQAPTVVAPSPLAPEVTAITRGRGQITIGDYNVENLDPVAESTAAGSVAGNDLYTRLGNSDDDVGSGKYAVHAQQIAVALGAPTIVALQEVQDSDGATISDVLDSDLTLQTLVDLISANHGVDYDFAYVSPPASNVNGGQPNANIRNAFLYQADQVDLLGVSLLTDPDPGAADRYSGDDFDDSRKPLVGQFEFDGTALTIVNNHFASKGGDNALFGNVQPPVLSSENQRIEQARIVNDYVTALVAADPAAKVLVSGDINDFTFSAPFRALDGSATGNQVLFDLGEQLLPVNERYSYNFDGNTQELDHQLVSRGLLDAAPAFDIVHVNSEFADQISDHDPSVSRFDFSDLVERQVLGDGDDRVNGNNGRDDIAGGGGNDRLFGNNGDDTLDGGAGDDLLRGGNGDDLFVLRAADGAGRDEIADFDQPGDDRIRLVGFAVDSFGEVLAAARQHGRDVVIDLGGNAELRLDGTKLSSLEAADFLFA